MSSYNSSELDGLAEAERLKGEPVREELSPDLEDPGVARGQLPRRRQAEVLMALPRPQGLLFHTKPFYPAGVLRLLTGGVHPGEPILEAARREVREETGLPLEPTRFLFHAVRRLRREGEWRRFHTLAFLYPLSSDPPTPIDGEEEISEFRDVPWEEIPELARRLDALQPPWDSWGAFRAGPHHLLLRLRRERPEVFAPILARE
jgi:8-oxo-dGTP pyrophosphatase MutT (NUDIX family)